MKSPITRSPAQLAATERRREETRKLRMVRAEYAAKAAARTAAAFMALEALPILLAEAKDWAEVMCGERPSLDAAIAKAEAALAVAEGRS